MRDRITAVAAQLGYTASRSASSLASGRTFTIGVVVPYMGRWFFGTVLDACVVRGRDDADARRRLDAAFDSGDPELLRRYRDLAARHLDVLAGDIGQERLGLDEDRHRSPVPEVTAGSNALALALTAGHSVTLAVTALGRLNIPGRPVEAFIAASIVVGAIHAIRPLFPGKEALVAGVFGLGHGMAFSFVLAEMHLSTGQLVTSLLGFNLGIELVQLLLGCLALPALLVPARLRIQPTLRLAGAPLTGTAAVGWLADRLGLPNPVARAADSAGSHTTPMPAALTVTALAATAWTLTTRQQARPRPAEPPAATCPEREERHTATTCEPHNRGQSPDTAGSEATHSR